MKDVVSVFYDGKCGLCLKEIRYYQKIAKPGLFNWQDITESNEVLEAKGIRLAEGLKYLHAMDQQDKLHVGVDAFILIWQQLDKWHILAKMIGLPGVRQLAVWVYRLFAAWRFKRLAHCQLAAKEDEG